MGFFDDIVPPDSAWVEGRWQPRTAGLFDDIVAPAVRVGTARLQFGDGDEIVGQMTAPGKSGFFHDDDPTAEPPAPRAVNGTPEHLTPLTGSPTPTNIDPLTGVPIKETSELGLFGRSVARGAIDMTGAAMKGGQVGLSNLTPSMVQTGGGEGRAIARGYCAARGGSAAIAAALSWW